MAKIGDAHVYIHYRFVPEYVEFWLLMTLLGAVVGLLLGALG